MLSTVIIELFLLIVVPITLIKVGIIKPKWRIEAILLVFLACALIFARHNIDLESIGFTDENFAEALEFYTVAALIGIAFIFGVAKLYRNRFEHDWYRDFRKIIFFVPLSFAQQFVFQGFVLHELLAVTSPITAVIVTAALFGYMHTIYPHSIRNMAITMVAGIYFASLYLVMPNLIAISLCHAALNFMIINFGFFTYPNEHEPLS